MDPDYGDYIRGMVEIIQRDLVSHTISSGDAYQATSLLAMAAILDRQLGLLIDAVNRGTVVMERLTVYLASSKHDDTILKDQDPQ